MILAIFKAACYLLLGAVAVTLYHASVPLWVLILGIAMLELSTIRGFRK